MIGVLFSLAALTLVSGQNLPSTIVSTCGCFKNHVIGSGAQFVRYCGSDCGDDQCASSGSSCPTDHSVSSQVRWGQSVSSDSYEVSGMGFTGVPPTDVVLDRDFYVGRLTHFNNRIYYAADSVELSINLVIDEFDVDEVFTFKLEIDETSNSGSLANCPYDSTVPCSDKITFDLAGFDQNSEFRIGNVDYTLRLTGFKEDTTSNSAPVTDFISNEGLINHAYLFGRIVTACPDLCENGGDVGVNELPDGSIGCGCDCSGVTCPDGLELKNDCGCACPFSACQGYESDPDNDCACTCPTPNSQDVCSAPKSHWNTDTCKCTCPPDQCGPGFLTDANQCTCSCNGVTCPGAQTPDPLDKCTCKCQKTCGPQQTLDTNTCTCACTGPNSCPDGFTWEVNPAEPLACRCGCEDLCGGGCNSGGEQECTVGGEEQCCASCKWTPAEPCDDTNKCTVNDQCTVTMDGSYTCAGTPKCPEPTDTCTVFSCDSETGDCIAAVEEDGAACGPVGSDPLSWNKCTSECQAGICVDKPPPKCPELGAFTCEGTYCNPATGECDQGLVPGKPCNDQNLCTVDDTCDDVGVCAGTAKSCDALDPIPCYEYVCNPLLGICEPRAEPAGSPCTLDADDMCQTEGTCNGGVCQFAPKCEALTGTESLCKYVECVSETGECVTQNRENGSPCVTESGFSKPDDLCIANYTCTDGVCDGSATGACEELTITQDAGDEAQTVIGLIAGAAVLVMILLAVGLWMLVQSQKLLDPSTWEGMDQAALQSNPLFESNEAEGTNALFVG